MKKRCGHEALHPRHDDVAERAQAQPIDQDLPRIEMEVTRGLYSFWR